MSTGLRLRAVGNKDGGSKTAGTTRGTSENDGKIISGDISLVSPLHWFLYAVYIIIIFLWAMSLDSKIPEPVSSHSAGNKRFSEERARRHLEALNSYGPRPAGSHGAEVLTRNYLLAEIEKIQKEANGGYRFDVDVQKPSGCYMLDEDFANCYKNVTNIIVRLGRRSQKSSHSLLINSHFDSVPASPGASDDAVSVSIMMELLNVISHLDPEDLPHDLIFLFNGAEENYLQASHGFITQHPWRHGIRAFINLEACGSGGREILFQVGPGNVWLSHAYLASAPYPYCNIIAQELFENNFIPSDTDFRIFRDYGYASGMDFAYINNGYVYHSEFDDASFVRPGSMQRGGDNVLATVLALLQSPCFTKPCPEQDVKLVFFDVLGLFAVSYPLSYGTLLNFAAAILVIIRIARHCQKASQGDTEGYSIWILLYALGTHALAIVFMVATILIMIKFVILTDLVMCWYSRPVMVVPLYLVPSLIAGFTIHAVASWWKYRPRHCSSGPTIPKTYDHVQFEEASFHAALLLLSLVLIVLTWYNVASAYYLLLHVLLPLGKDLLWWICQKVIVRGGISATSIFLCHAAALSPIIAIGSYGVLSVLQFFIPIMGRSGTVTNPELFVASICLACSIAIVLYMGGLVHLTASFTEVLKFLVFATSISIAVAAFTSFVAPYRYDPEAPRLRRIRMQHVSRTIYNVDSTRNSSDNALYITGMDYRGVHDLPPATFLQSAQTPPCLSDDAYCGLPYYSPDEERRPPEKNLWISVPSAPHIETPVRIQLTNRLMEKNAITFTFSVTTHDYGTFYISPLNNWTLDDWNFTNNYIFPHKTYFVRLTYVGDSKNIGPWRFSLKLKRPESNAKSMEEPKLLLGVASHYVHGPYKDSDVTEPLIKNIRERRQKPPTSTMGYWKWMMTPDTFNSEYVAQYFV